MAVNYEVVKDMCEPYHLDAIETLRAIKEIAYKVNG